LLTVLLLALAVSWLAVGGAARAVHEVTAGAPSAATQVAGDECEFIGSPGGPARCDHNRDHRTFGRLHPSVADQDLGGTGYPADDLAATADGDSPTARPPAPPSLAELQVWRR
jgi:hypothetical protein